MGGRLLIREFGVRMLVDARPYEDKMANTFEERIEFHAGIWQCKQVFLACCHDEGYATFLGQFVSTSKLTLVKHTAFNAKFKTLGLPVVEFPGVFAGQSTPEGFDKCTGKTTLQNPYALQWRLGPILVDKKSGLRYDRFISTKKDAVKKFEKLRLCFYFYLTGSCKGCDRKHALELKLTIDEFDALWQIARRGECYNSRKRKSCTDAFCFYGHKL